MSEYQYYEWQTIDRSLTAREQEDVNRLSSHMDTVTSTQAIVTSSWGDFKHDHKQVLLKYFDAFLYDSNFGVRELMFRLPKKLVDVDLFQPYLIEDRIMLEEHGAYFVLHIEVNDEADYFEWIESEGIGQYSSRLNVMTCEKSRSSSRCRRISSAYIGIGVDPVGSASTIPARVRIASSTRRAACRPTQS